MTTRWHPNTHYSYLSRDKYGC